jgi:hypothetical protein
MERQCTTTRRDDRQIERSRCTHAHLSHPTAMRVSGAATYLTGDDLDCLAAEKK